MKTSVLSRSFDPAPYLLREALTLVEIFALMRNKNPTRSAAPSVDQNPLFQAVKFAIDDGSLSALRRKADTAYLRSAISLSDAHAFVIARKDDPVWNPPGAPDRINFYRFCQKWAAGRGEEWSEAESQRSASLSNARPECERRLTALMKQPKKKTITKLRVELTGTDGIKGLSAKAFDRAVAEVRKSAKIDPTWNKPGPISKG